MPKDADSTRQNPLHVAIAELEDEMTAALKSDTIPDRTRRSLQARLRELKAKAGVDA